MRRGNEFGAFAAGLGVGSSLVALGVGLLALAARPLPFALLVLVVCTAGFACFVLEAMALDRYIPQRRRLIPQWVFSVPVAGSFQFGVELGTGARTYSPTSLPHLLVVAAVVSGSPTACFAASAGFALGRAMVPLLFIASRTPTAVEHGLEGRSRSVRALVAALFVVTLLGIAVKSRQ